VLGCVSLATPYGNPGCLPLSNPTKCRKLGLVQWFSLRVSFEVDLEARDLSREGEEEVETTGIDVALHVALVTLAH
jgi:hypothetical protein